jgi:hypothetical protein
MHVKWLILFGSDLNPYLITQGTFDNFFWPVRFYKVGAARSIFLRPTWAQSAGCRRLF